MVVTAGLTFWRPVEVCRSSLRLSGQFLQVGQYLREFIGKPPQTGACLGPPAINT